MKRTLFILIFLLSTAAHAGANLLIEHPRNPSQKRDRYRIDCLKKCAVEIVARESAKGELDENFETRIKEIFSLSLPESSKLKSSRLVYTVTAIDGDKKIELRLAHVEEYKGEQLLKYLGVISYIETLKKSMRSELAAAGVKK